MAELFSVDGLGGRLDNIGRLAQKSGFVRVCAPDAGLSASRGAELGILFLSYRLEAPKIIMVISGTHGVEGPAGYDLQFDLLQKRVHEQLPKDVGLVFVVALNPWGWAHGRRTDKNNVDLNRNGWSTLPPILPALDSEINALVNPEQCDEEWYRELTGWLTNPEKCKHLRAQVFYGQYDNPRGIFYGGQEKSWSLKSLQWYCYYHLKDPCRHLAILDIHTGLGEWGEIILISSARPDDQKLQERIRSWFGLAPVFPNLGQTEIVNVVSSDLLSFVARCLPKTEVTALACGIGTKPFEQGFPVFVAENWTHQHQPADGTVWLKTECSTTKEGQRQFRNLFYPPNSGFEDDRNWSAVCRGGFMPIFRTVVRGLSES
ncbi:MAG: DUF2817 domain-containing protein [Candidatus Vogelbacteria bacterium]|nr:DUF2817 domain-containing protein [Candidatus Vogelbacteria bacterium]